MGNVGPGPRRSDPVAKLTDIALKIVELCHLAGDPLGWQMAAAFRQMTVHPVNDPGMRLGPGLEVVGKPPDVPATPDRRRIAHAVGNAFLGAIGRASGRESVCQYVEYAVVSVALK